MIYEAGIDFAELPDTEPDSPFADYTGAGVIFGVTGGVTEAVIRHVIGASTTEQIASIAECGVRGLEGIKAFEVTAGELTLKIAVASGLGNADKLIEKIESGEEFFHFVEVMACPGGCIGGGGQPAVRRSTFATRVCSLPTRTASCVRPSRTPRWRSFTVCCAAELTICSTFIIPTTTNKAQSIIPYLRIGDFLRFYKHSLVCWIFSRLHGIISFCVRS